MSRTITAGARVNLVNLRWLREIVETVYAIALAIGLMGGVWGGVYYFFGSNGLLSRISSSVVVGEHGASSLLAVSLALLTALAIIFWLPRMQSSRPASALLGAVVVGGYSFLFRALATGV